MMVNATRTHSIRRTGLSGRKAGRGAQHRVWETGFGLTFTVGTEVATGGANVSPDGSSASFSIGDETAFGEAFQNLITFSTGDLALTIWNETDDSETSDWTLVDPGSTD